MREKLYTLTAKTLVKRKNNCTQKIYFVPNANTKIIDGFRALLYIFDGKKLCEEKREKYTINADDID